VKPAEYRRMYLAEESQWWYVGQRAIVQELLRRELGKRLGNGGAQSRRLLDAGCGTGANLAALQPFARTVGVDLAEEAIGFCRERGLTVARGSVLALPLVSGCCELVVSLDVLYHAWVSDDRLAVAEMARVLAPGGLLLVRVPALRVLWGAHDREVQSRHRYTRCELVALVEGCGLELRRASYCNSLLFPLLLLRRTLDRVLAREGSDVGFLPAPLEWAFRRALLLEATLLARGASFPVGASVVALARKPEGPVAGRP
jgi:SAM-dependent methyltransferase